MNNGIKRFRSKKGKKHCFNEGKKKMNRNKIKKNKKIKKKERNVSKD